MQDNVKTVEPKRNYTGHGWEGNRYDRNLGIVEIAKIVRSELKKKYPECKFSVTTDKYSMGQSMDVRLVSANFEVFEKPNENDNLEKRTRKEQTIACGNTGVNHYYIDQAYELTPKVKEVMKFTKSVISGFNYDDSDAQIDYFDTNFYYSLAIGRWDRPFKLVQ